MNKFSIKIDLSTFFEDERKMVLIMVDPNWDNVQCLQKRVETLFEVDAVRFLNNDVCFLPPQEPIEIVRFCKELKAFIPKESLDKRKKKKSIKEKAGVTETECEEAFDTAVSYTEESNDVPKKKKRKYRSLESSSFASSTPNNNSKRLKNYVDINATIHHIKQINKSSEISSTSEQIMPPPLVPKRKKANKTESNVSSATVTDYSEDIVSQKNDSSADETYGKSKRKKEFSSATVNDYSEDIVSQKNDSSADETCGKSKHKKKVASATGKKPSEDIVSQINDSCADETSGKSKHKKKLSSATVTDCGEDIVSQENNSSADETSEKSSCYSFSKNNCSVDDTSGKSKRKQKLSKLAEDKSTEMSAPPARISSLPSSTFISESRKSQKLQRSPNNPFKNLSSNLKHLHFNESGEISTTKKRKTHNKENDKPAATKVVFHCPLNEINTKTPRVFHINHSYMVTKKCNKPVIEIEEIIILKPGVAQNNLNKSQDFEVIQTGENEESSVAVSNADLGENVAKDDKCTAQEDESVVDEGNSSLNDTNISSATTAIDKCNRTSTDKSQLAENSHAGEQCQAEDVSVNLTTNVDDESSSYVKDENESSIVSVDCVDLSVDVDDEDETEYKQKPRKSARNIKVPDISISDTSDIEEVIDLNESEDQSSSSSLSATNTISNGVKISRIISWCKEAKDLPDSGDIMIFKIPFTNRQGNPDCTKFLAGKAERIQYRTKSIKLLILDGFSELSYVPGKYLDKYVDNSLSDEQYVQIKFSEMIQPRLLPKNKRSLVQ